MTTRNINVKKSATVEAVEVATPDIIEVTAPKEPTEVTIPAIIEQENVIVPRETPAPIRDFSTITEKEVRVEFPSFTRDTVLVDVCNRPLSLNESMVKELLTLGITRKFSTSMAKETDTREKHKAAIELIELLESGYWTIRDKKAAEKPLIIANTAGKSKGNTTIPAIGRFELIGMMRDLCETEKEATQTEAFNLFDETRFNAVVAARMADKNPNSLVYRAILELQAQAVKAVEKARAIEAEKTAALLDELDTL